MYTMGAERAGPIGAAGGAYTACHPCGFKILLFGIFCVVFFFSILDLGSTESSDMEPLGSYIPVGCE